MTKEKGALGRGLSAILGNNAIDFTSSSNSKDKNSSIFSSSTHEIHISQIVANPFQPRSKFNQEKLNELAISIEQLGVIQPITVRRMKKDHFQLISGERRLRATQMAGIDKIPAFIRVANDKEMLEMALVENIQRENLNPIEVALSYERLIKEINLTQEQCSERVGKKRSTVTNFLRLLRLPEQIQKALIDGLISNGHARSLLTISSEDSQINLCHDIIANGYSVREVEQLSKEFSEKKYKRMSKIKSSEQKTSFFYQKIIYELSKKLETQIESKISKKGNGKLIIIYKDDDDFERITKIIKN